MRKLENLIKFIAQGVETARWDSECREVDLNQVGIDGRTPLMVAAAGGYLGAVETLVRNGASIHARGRDRTTPLHEACSNGNASVAKYLLSIGAPVDPETIDGVTPLMCAAAWGNLEVVKLLSENGADQTKTDCAGATAADIALEKCDNNTADLISSYLKSRE